MERNSACPTGQKQPKTPKTNGKSANKATQKAYRKETTGKNAAAPTPASTIFHPTEITKTFQSP